MSEHANLLQSPSEATSDDATSSRTEHAGYLLMLTSSAFFSVFVLLQRDAVGPLHLPGSTAFLAQASIVLALSAAFLPCQSRSRLLHRRLRRDELAALLLRGLFGAVGVICGTFSYVHLPAGLALSLFFTCPLFAALFARALLREPVTPADLAAMFAAAGGVALIAVPSLHVRHLDVHFGGVALALVSALFEALGYVLVRRIGTHVHFGIPVSSVAAFSVIIGVLAGGTAKLTSAAKADLSASALVMGAAGVMSFFARLTETAALQKTPAGVAVLLKAVEVPLTFVLGTVFLREFPTKQKLLGSALVVASAVFVTIRRSNTRP